MWKREWECHKWLSCVKKSPFFLNNWPLTLMSSRQIVCLRRKRSIFIPSNRTIACVPSGLLYTSIPFIFLLLLPTVSILLCRGYSANAHEYTTTRIKHTLFSTLWAQQTHSICIFSYHIIFILCSFVKCT